MIGQTIGGRYQIKQELGGGGFGKTYIAQDLQRPGLPSCVVKQLLITQPSLDLLNTARRLFKQEAETLEKLGTHPQIPRLLAYFEESEQFYLVQELIDGEPLSAELGRQKWTELQVVELLQELLSILSFVHSHDVIHRDIKPENIIRRSDGKLFLIDFGAVKAWKQVTNIHQSPQTIGIGTLGYMPIEQANGKPIPSSDLYALGKIAIYALTAKPPMHLGTEINNEANWQKEVQASPTLIQFLTKIVSDRPAQRYSSATEALQALQTIIAASASPPSTAWNHPDDNRTVAVFLSPAPNNRRLMVWLVVSFAFVVGLGIAYLWVQSTAVIQGDNPGTPIDSDNLDLSQPSEVNPFARLDYPLAVCGDTSVTRPFYRVHLAEVSSLNRAKAEFCQDAIVKDNRVQVAAFDQLESAQQFQQFLQRYFEAVEIEVVQ